MATKLSRIKAFFESQESCKPLVKTIKTDFEFSGIKGEFGAIKLDIGSLKTESAKVHEISKIASAIDKLQVRLCEQQRNLKKGSEKYEKFMDMRASVAIILGGVEILAEISGMDAELRDQKISELLDRLNKVLDSLYQDVSITMSLSSLDRNTIQRLDSLRDEAEGPTASRTVTMAYIELIENGRLDLLFFAAKDSTVETLVTLASQY